MIRHCVFIRFKASVSIEDKQSMMADIIDLKTHLPGIQAVHVGGNVSPETGMDKGYSDGFIVDFDGPDTRDAYLSDPRHEAAGARLVAAAQDGASGILVYDLEIADR